MHKVLGNDNVVEHELSGVKFRYLPIILVWLCLVSIGRAQPKQPRQQSSRSALSGEQTRIREESVGHRGAELGRLVTLADRRRSTGTFDKTCVCLFIFFNCMVSYC